MSKPQDIPFVSRAGLKLEHALNEFAFDVTGLFCADFGCNVGGFTDCLLQRGAAQVYALDTGYGTLAWKLRSDDRVIVMERTNALHAELPSASPGKGREVRGEAGSFTAKQSGSDKPKDVDPEPSPLTPLPEGEGENGVDLVTIDLGWTPQRLAIPAARKWLRTPTSTSPESPEAHPAIITLIKPHYELDEAEKRERLVEGALTEADAEDVLQRVLASMPALHMQVIAHVKSPLTGRKSSKRAKRPNASRPTGNVEYLALLKPLFVPKNDSR